MVPVLPLIVSSAKRASLVLALAVASGLLLAACGGDGGGEPAITSLNCHPTAVGTDEIVSCSPDASGAVDTHWWSTSGGSPSSGIESSFSTRYGSTGTRTITLLACHDGGCSSAAQLIEVGSAAPASEPRPTIASLQCNPTMSTTDDTVFCDPSVTGIVTSYSWFTSGGVPSSGAESTFSTSHSSTGTKRISLQACNSDGCSRRSQTVLVGPAPDPPDSDGDGVVDPSDNCERIPNPDQSNVDGDRNGDACDAQDNRDSDRDGIQNWDDQCPSEAENLDGYLDEDGCPDIPEVAVSIEQGDGFVFESGEAVTICYSVSGEMFVEIDLVAPSGQKLDLLSAFNDGSGGCFDWELGDDPEPGSYAVEIAGAEAQGSTSFEAR